MTQLLSRPAEELNLGNFKLGVAGTAEEIELTWTKVNLERTDEELAWSSETPLNYKT